MGRDNGIILKNKETYVGTVDKVIYMNEETGYSVILFLTKKNYFTAVGILPYIQEGEYLKITGKFVDNKKHGIQFEIESVEFNNPTELSDIYNYLASGLFKGVGPKLAEIIVSFFGKDTFDVLENHPEKLREVPGIGRKKAEDILASYYETKAMKDTIIFLQSYNISLGLATKIYCQYGETTISRLRENPYILVSDIRGVGFLTADAIAKNLGIDSNSRFRIEAGIYYILRDVASASGHTCLPEEMLIKNVSKLLNLDIERVNEVYKTTPKLCREIVDDQILVSISTNYIIESSIAIKLKILNECAKNDTRFDVKKAIEAYERRNHFELDEGQIEAVESIFDNAVSVITGGPGTGKTTIIKAIVDIIMGRRKTFALCAPTGRASKRMSQATGIEAKTIHRLIGYSAESHKNLYNERNQLDTDVIIIDEISMCDIYIFNALLKAVRNDCKLILVGDKDQLPSVACGNILKDIIDSKVINVVSLKTIHRQSENSTIVTNAHKINNGEMPEISNTKDFFLSTKILHSDIIDDVVTMVKARIPTYLNITPADIQVLAPMKNGESGVNVINSVLQRELNPSTNVFKAEEYNFKLGDRVMHTQNNYDLEWTDLNTGYTGYGVFNGDLGYVVDMLSDGIVVQYEDDRLVRYTKETIKQLQLAYAISVHKSQGSEFPVIILVLSRYSPMLVTRNLIYTAVTRARKMVVIVGNKEILRKGILNDYTAKRYTLLKHFLEMSGSSNSYENSYPNKGTELGQILIPDDINTTYSSIFTDDEE